MSNSFDRHGGAYTPSIGGQSGRVPSFGNTTSFSSHQPQGQGPTYFVGQSGQTSYYGPQNAAHGGAYTPSQSGSIQGVSSNVPARQTSQNTPAGAQHTGGIPGSFSQNAGSNPAGGSSSGQEGSQPAQQNGSKSYDEEKAIMAAEKDQRTPMHQRGYFNLPHVRTAWKWAFPNAYQKSGYKYESKTVERHRDGMGREKYTTEDDRYLSPWDGRLAKLVVQCTDELYDGPQNTTWRRTFIRNWGPILLRVANWPTKTVSSSNPAEWSGEDWGMIIVRWIPSVLALYCLMPFPVIGVVSPRNNGWYDPFTYRYWGYPKVARNRHEDAGPKQLDFQPEQKVNPEVETLLRPRYLCFLNEPGDKENLHGVVPMSVDEWINQHGSESNMDYLFVAYTTEQFNHASIDSDMPALSELAERATRDAGLPAYWIGSSCMRDDDLEKDVHRISDVIRGAHSLAIIIGHPVNRRAEKVTRTEMLRGWGSRMWTLPEGLLSPQGRPIKVYTRGLDKGEPWAISKSSFASHAWGDATVVRQLVDHYEGSMILSRLELVIIALRCLYTRQTRQYFPGDLSYALMGLLRRRPLVDPTDSAFQAFARLSLANDSDMLLERLVCVLPKERHQPWLSADDAWDASLWDIYPTCQVAGVGPGDTVILDGAFGTAIRWKSFAPVYIDTQDSWKRVFARLVLRSCSLYLIVGAALVGAAGTNSAMTIAGALVLVVSLLAVLASPYLIRVIYGGKRWNTQAWLIGLEGYLDIETIEANLFGRYEGNLSWSPFGSPLSRHSPNDKNECIGLDPSTDREVRAQIEAAKTSQPGEPKIFTIIDTNLMTVTLFSAVRPPIAALLCGNEGGMQRAVMCSYEWKTQTLYRETVLRMETPVLEKMSRVPRFRFGFQRPEPGIEPRSLVETEEKAPQ